MLSHHWSPRCGHCSCAGAVKMPWEGRGQGISMLCPGKVAAGIFVENVLCGAALWHTSLHVCCHAQSCLTLCNLVNCSPPRSFCLWVLLGKNTGVGCQFLLQGIFPTQESKLYFLRLLYCRWILYHWAIMEAPIQVSSTIQSILLWRREAGRGIPLQFRTTGRAQAWEGEKGSLNGSGHCLFSLLPGSAQEDSSAQGRCRCLSS